MTIYTGPVFDMARQQFSETDDRGQDVIEVRRRAPRGTIGGRATTNVGGQ